MSLNPRSKYVAGDSASILRLSKDVVDLSDESDVPFGVSAVLITPLD